MSESSNPCLLEIRNLSKTYKGGKKAVDHLNLRVEAGDIYGFIGHNGAGKSTTIKALAGILDFEEGQILIDGKDIQNFPVECKRITAYIPDNPDLYEYLTGIQFLNLIGDVYDIPSSKRRELIEKYSDMLEITGSLGGVIASYSHGMKQKVAVISALIHEPRLLVMDEPFVGLDPKATHTLKGIMREMCSQGNAIFFSTHVLEVAQTLCSKIAILKDGRLMVEGDTEKLTHDESLESLFMEVIDHDDT